MAALENGVAAVAASSGQSAQFMAISTIVRLFFFGLGRMLSIYDAFCGDQAGTGDNIVARFVSVSVALWCHN